MKYVSLIIILTLGSCSQKPQTNELSESDRLDIRKAIQAKIDQGVEATRTKDIEVYMDGMPEDLTIYDENGDTITREQQKQYALRDWSIIDTTFFIEMKIDSIQHLRDDSVFVYTSQQWQRMMFRRDGITTDTILTTQLHREVWKKTNNGWYGYEIEELGGEIFINGEKYSHE